MDCMASKSKEAEAELPWESDVAADQREGGGEGSGAPSCSDTGSSIPIMDDSVCLRQPHSMPQSPEPQDSRTRYSDQPDPVLARLNQLRPGLPAKPDASGPGAASSPGAGAASSSGAQTWRPWASMPAPSFDAHAQAQARKRGEAADVRKPTALPASVLACRNCLRSIPLRCTAASSCRKICDLGFRKPRARKGLVCCVVRHAWWFGGGSNSPVPTIEY